MLTVFFLKKKVSASVVLPVSDSAAFKGLLLRDWVCVLFGKKIDNIGESGIRQSSTAVQVVLSEIHIKRHIHVVNIFILIVVSHFR